MFGLRELDLMDTYNPNFDDIRESAEITYETANNFFSSNELNVKEIVRQISTGEVSSPIKIYAKKRAAVSMLAECCEMYLKALFLYEHRSGSLTCKELWSILEAKIKEDKSRDDARVRDKNGNIVYYQTASDNETPLHHPDGTIKYVYAKVDSSGNLEKNADGNQIYVDKLGNEYDENRKGKAVKTNGHALDRLIELLSPESRLMLETRLFTIPMDTTEKNRNVSIIDILQRKGLVSSNEHISRDQYDGWLDQHKRAFEEARYPGEKRTLINIEFMYHLENQIRAVVQYMMNPKKTQKFTITDEEFGRLAPEIKQLASINANLLSAPLIKLIAEDETIKSKVFNIFSQNYILPNDISQINFYYIIKLMSSNEIECVSYLCWLMKNINQLDDKYIKNNNQIDKLKAYKLVQSFKRFNINSRQIVEYCIEIKRIFKNMIEIGSDNFYDLLSAIMHEMANVDLAYNMDNIKIFKESKKALKDSENDIDINLIMNNYYKF